MGPWVLAYRNYCDNLVCFSEQIGRVSSINQRVDLHNRSGPGLTSKESFGTYSDVVRETSPVEYR